MAEFLRIDGNTTAGTGCAVVADGAGTGRDSTHGIALLGVEHCEEGTERGGLANLVSCCPLCCPAIFCQSFCF